MNAKEIALCVFETKKYPYTTDELDLFIQRIEKINELGLIELNKAIKTAKDNIDDKIVEHNFAHELLKYNADNINIEYEPPYLKLPPDFKVIKNYFEFWFQVKNPSLLLKKINLRNKIFETLKRKISNIKIKKQVSIFLYDIDYEAFRRNEIDVFVDFIRQHSTKENGYKYYFPDNNDPKAEIDFCLSDISDSDNLELGCSGDAEMINITPTEQIKESLDRAAKCFNQNENHENIINIIVLKADLNYRNYDIANALYGTAGNSYLISSTEGVKQNGWNRDSNGFLNNSKISNKITAVIIIRPKDKNMILTSYSKILLMNEQYKDRVDAIKQVIEIDDITFF